MIHQETGDQPHEQIKPQLTAGQGHIKQEGGRRCGGEKHHILHKHRRLAAGQQQTDHPKHIVIHADQKPEPAA